MYLWLADLWDDEIGAFYYSNSARDTEGYLPDIESTCQAIAFLQHTGIYSCLGGTLDSFTPDFMKSKIVDFVIGLQDTDGFFYHPQWGKNIGISRRGRDLGWCTDTLMTMGGKAKYPTPLDTPKTSSNNLLPPHLQTADAFREYLSGLDLYNQSYYVGNLLASQLRQIRAAGSDFEDILIDWYDKNQCSDNGLWNPTTGYHSINGLMKITMAYSHFNKPISYADRALNSCISVVCMEQNNPQITSHYNPWITIRMLLNNVETYGGKDQAEQLRSELICALPEMLRRTKVKVSAFQKKDGTFSYKPTCSSFHSQGAPVAVPNTNEGDINGNGLASSGIAKHVCDALGIEKIPFYTQEDGELFFELIKSSIPSKKLYPKPEKMIPD